MIITSFSAQGYEEYGKRFIDGFLKNWQDESLTVYVEGQQTALSIAQDYQSVAVVDLLRDKQFIKYAALLKASDPMYCGQMRNPQTGEPTYNFRYDANKFFRKVYAVTQYNDKHLEAVDPFAWLDADIVFHRKIPQNFLKDLLAGHAMAILGRTNMYSETGFVAWDPSADTHRRFMQLYRNIYLSGAFRLLTEWHDCQVMDFARIALEIDARNLAKGCDPNHPFVYSVLGTYMDHLKGPERKELGRSPEGQANVA